MWLRPPVCRRAFRPWFPHRPHDAPARGATGSDHPYASAAIHTETRDGLRGYHPGERAVPTARIYFVEISGVIAATRLDLMQATRGVSSCPWLTCPDNQPRVRYVVRSLTS